MRISNPNVLTAGDAALARVQAVADLVAAQQWDAAIRFAEVARVNREAVSQPLSLVGATPAAASASSLPPDYVIQRESGGDYNAFNPTGCGGRSCGGRYQFDPRTWNNYGGYLQAQMAPPEVQDAKAREVWSNGAGCAAWAAC